MPLDFQPGTRWAYSAQAGFDTLARVVEIASGMPFDQFTQAAHLRSARHEGHVLLSGDGNPRMVPRYDAQAKRSLEKQGEPANFMNGAYFSGGGGLMSTAEDYLQFAQMLLNGGQLNGKRAARARARWR